MLSVLSTFFIFLALSSSYASENTLGILGSGLFHTWSNSGGDTVEIPPQKQYACLWKHVRHLVSFPLSKGHFASRVNYHSNSDCSFHLIRLIVSGDITVNPRLEKCVVCLKTVAWNHRALSCNQCDSWCHIQCGDVTPKQYIDFQQMDDFSWICPPCLLSVLFSSNTRLNSTLNSSIDSSMVSSGESQVDEIANYKTNVLSHYKYNISIAHININSIWNKIDEVKLLLNEGLFHILAISETKLDSTYNSFHLQYPHYRMLWRDRKKGGGGLLWKHQEHCFCL